MDFTSTGFIIAIVLVSGVIAYVADILGKKLGKQRRSLWGLRPRHTAAVFTVAFGMTVSLATIVLVGVVSAPVRRWMFYGARALDDLNQEKLKLQEEQTQVAVEKRNLLEARQQGEDFQRQITVRKKIFNQQMKMANKVYHANVDLQAKNKDLSGSIRSQKSDLAALGTQKQALEKVKIGLQNELQVNRKDVMEVNQELQLEKKNLKAAQDAQEQYAEFNFQLKKDFVQTRFKSMIYRRYQEVARLSIGPNLTSEQADEALRSVLIKARLEAAEHGARAFGKYKVADIVDLPDNTPVQKIMRRLHDEIVGRPEPMVLVAVASMNFYENEPIIIEIHPSLNPVIYHRGEVVDETQLHGSESDKEIIQELTAFGASIREKAQRDQMLPRVNGESYGSVPADEVFSLINQVKQRGKVVTLEAVVQNETRAADPLKIDFRIR